MLRGALAPWHKEQCMDVSSPAAALGAPRQGEQRGDSVARK